MGPLEKGEGEIPDRAALAMPEKADAAEAKAAASNKRAAESDDILPQKKWKKLDGASADTTARDTNTTPQQPATPQAEPPQATPQAEPTQAATPQGDVHPGEPADMVLLLAQMGKDMNKDLKKIAAQARLEDEIEEAAKPKSKQKLGKHDGKFVDHFYKLKGEKKIHSQHPLAQAMMRRLTTAEKKI